MSFAKAREIFNHMVSRSKELRNDLGLRGRTSVAPLTKMGLATAKKTTGAIVITDLGNAFLKGKVDIGDVYFRFFIKWQIPNPVSNDYAGDGTYNIKPFIGTLHLINQVNLKEIKRGKNPKGLSNEEFALFSESQGLYPNISWTYDPDTRDRKSGQSQLWYHMHLNSHTPESKRQILSGGKELKIFDVSAPSSINEVGGFNSSEGDGNGKSLYLVSNKLYLGKTVPNAGADFHILNNTDPASTLTEIGPGIDSASSINGIIVRGYLAFFITNTQFQTWNISDPTAIVSYASPLALPGTGIVQGTAADCEGNYIYV